jgi:hypothetical protein
MAPGSLDAVVANLESCVTIKADVATLIATRTIAQPPKTGLVFALPAPEAPRRPELPGLAIAMPAGRSPSS